MGAKVLAPDEGSNKNRIVGAIILPFKTKTPPCGGVSDFRKTDCCLAFSGTDLVRGNILGSIRLAALGGAV